MKVYRVRFTTHKETPLGLERREIEDTFFDFEEAKTAYIHRAEIATVNEDLQLESFELISSITGSRPVRSKG